MTLMNRGWVRVLTVLAALTLVSCAGTLTPYTPDQHALNMGVSKARQVVLEALRHGGPGITGSPATLFAYTQCQIGADGQFSSGPGLVSAGQGYGIAHANVRITMRGITITNAVGVTPGILIIDTARGQNVVLPFQDMQIDTSSITYGAPLSDTGSRNNLIILYPKQAGCFALGFADPETATDFAGALLVLKREAAAESTPRFEAAVRAYREAAVKPPLPEAVHRFTVQALDAVRHNQLNEAADLYEQASEAAPWWPEAHFDRALLLGKTQDYDDAVLEMKRYLLLAPHAPNAHAVQDQIYIWERKAEVSAP